MGLLRLIQSFLCGHPGSSVPRDVEGHGVDPCVTWTYDLFPQTVYPHQGVLAVSVKAGAWSGCSSWFEVHFDCAGSHKVCVAVLGSCIFPVNFIIKWLLWNVLVHFDCAGSHKTWGAVLACGPLPVNFRIKRFLWHLHVHFDCSLHKTWGAVFACGLYLQIAA